MARDGHVDGDGKPARTQMNIRFSTPAIVDFLNEAARLAGYTSTAAWAKSTLYKEAVAIYEALDKGRPPPEKP